MRPATSCSTRAQASSATLRRWYLYGLALAGFVVLLLGVLAVLPANPRRLLLPEQASKVKSAIRRHLMLYGCRLDRLELDGAKGGGAVGCWPQGKGAEVDGLDALAAKVKGTPGAIGYGGITTVKSNGFTSVSLKNRAGEFVKADVASFTKAAEAEDWSVAGFNVDMVDEEAAGAWPIVGANFVLVPENPAAEKASAYPPHTSRNSALWDGVLKSPARITGPWWRRSR